LLVVGLVFCVPCVAYCFGVVPEYFYYWWWGLFLVCGCDVVFDCVFSVFVGECVVECVWFGHGSVFRLVLSGL